jgi:hypothetical protein
MVAAQVDAVSGAHAQGQFMTQQVTAIGIGLIERAATLEAMAPLSPKAGMQQQLEGLAGKKLWGQRPGPLGTSETITNHAGHGFARREHCWLIRHKAGVHQVNEASVVDNRRDHASMIEAFNVHLVQW